ncbi:GtrA family protein [Parapedobacter indicus]|uniref:Putative flippase GtrA (Transmembrane translocase of bactoprenol-linked glucose) n=1 Tax=Parapedobacter indicus TaxID=1477437 RepID=A0A1I3DHA9_9SPHI|nr:GtrA family protein [Parapedobacter indicus]PPL04677.1 putative flippase GtrA [Parapedobacter indicus]SFH86140.1 Putative flippase GtrA (transmembrane translocase of bactoprenol-linked glucose) [Parapedobacter indicus]
MVIDSEFFTKFLRFGLVGLSGVVVDFGITWLCKEKFKFHKYVANSLGFCTATVTNYLLNKYWTFHATGQDMFFEFSKFVGFALVGLLINNLVLFLLHGKMKLNFYLSKLIAIAIVSIWNFLGNYLYTFSA